MQAAQLLYKKYEQWTEEEIRAELFRKAPVFEDFSQTHPRLFLLLSAKIVEPAHRMHILNLIGLKKDHQQRNLSVAEQQREVSEYMQSHFVRPAKPGEEEDAVASGSGVRGKLVDMRPSTRTKK